MKLNDAVARKLLDELSTKLDCDGVYIEYDTIRIALTPLPRQQSVEFLWKGKVMFGHDLSLQRGDIFQVSGLEGRIRVDVHDI